MVQCNIGLIGRYEIVLAFRVGMNDNLVAGIACRSARIG